MQHSALPMTQTEKDKLLDEWMRDFGDDIFRLCFIILQDRMLAEDASQEVFIKAYKRADTLRQREYTKTWLVSIAVSVVAMCGVVGAWIYCKNCLSPQ